MTEIEKIQARIDHGEHTADELEALNGVLQRLQQAQLGSDKQALDEAHDTFYDTVKDTAVPTAPVEEPDEPVNNDKNEPVDNGRGTGKDEGGKG